MQFSPAEMVNMVFKHVVPCDLSQYSCTSHMLTLLVHIDGVSNLSAVSKKAGMTINEAVDAIAQLSSLNIIESAENGNSFLSAGFMETLYSEFSAAVGPIAEILIEDAIKDLGHTWGTFPVSKAEKLVELLAKDIKRQDKYTAFRNKMMAGIKQG